MFPKGKQKDPSSNALQPLSPRTQTIHQQGVKSTTRKRRQGENSTPTRRSHRNKGLQPDVVLETVEEDCASSMHSNHQPQVQSKENTMTLSTLLGQHQNISEDVATKIVDNIVDLVAEQVIEESTLEKSHQENQDNLQYDDTEDSQENQHFQVTQTSPGNQHFQETPDSQHTEQFQEQQLSLVNQRSQHREHSLTLSQGTISTSQFTGGPSEGVTNRRKKEKVNFIFICIKRFEFIYIYIFYYY